MLTVLFGLAVVTVLISASVSRTVAHVKIARHAIRAQQDAALHDAALEVVGAVIASRPDDLPREPLSLRIDDQDVVIEFQNVNGLVDINSASPELLTAVFTGFMGAAGVEVAERLQALRHRDRRWSNTRELVRLGLIDHLTFARLRPHLTVYSGRPELELRHASAELRQVLSNGKFDRAGSQSYSRGARLFQLDIRIGGRVEGFGAVVQLTNGRQVEVAVVAMAGD